MLILSQPGADLGLDVSVDHGAEGGLGDQGVEPGGGAEGGHHRGLQVVDPGQGGGEGRVLSEEEVGHHPLTERMRYSWSKTQI